MLIGFQEDRIFCGHFNHDFPQETVQPVFTRLALEPLSEAVQLAMLILEFHQETVHTHQLPLSHLYFVYIFIYKQLT
jgi:hypothetical protein